MPESILNTTKKSLGLDVDYPAFDPDVIMLINSALSTLTQLGIGPANGFMITGAAETWDAFLGEDPVANMAKHLVFLKVKLVFDPPATSFVIGAMEKQIEELTWRLNVHRESTEWVDPDPRRPVQNVFGDPLVIDGGVG